MVKMRPQVRKGDWVIATLGKCYPNVVGDDGRKEHFSNNLDSDYTRHLVYAMKVTEIKGNNLLVSNDFYGFSEKPIKIKKDFSALIKKGRAYLRFPHKGNEESDKRLMGSFIEWLQSSCANNHNVW